MSFDQQSRLLQNTIGGKSKERNLKAKFSILPCFACDDVIFLRPEKTFLESCSFPPLRLFYLDF